MDECYGYALGLEFQWKTELDLNSALSIWIYSEALNSVYENGQQFKAQYMFIVAATQFTMMREGW